MRAPDFFHVGHPRSGTGIVYRCLAAHPDIYMARKELHGFGSDIGFDEPPRSLDNYLAHFRHARDESRVGDASTWYLASLLAAQEIKAFRPDARIVISLRNPVDMLHSLHAHLVANLDEDLADFGEALAAEPERRRGRRLPTGSFPRIALYYRQHTRYTEQILRYLDAFGPKQVHVVLFDDLRADPEGTIRRLYAFLGVDTIFPGFRQVLDVSAEGRNGNWTVRSRRLQRVLKMPVNRAVYAGVREQPLPGWLLALRTLRRVNIRRVERPPMDPNLRRRLTEELAPEMERTAQLLGRDLSAWMGGRRRAGGATAEDRPDMGAA